MDPNYKARKEAFVSGLAGGSILEINAVTLVASVSATLPYCGYFVYIFPRLIESLRNRSGIRFPLVNSAISPILFRSLQRRRPGR